MRTIKILLVSFLAITLMSASCSADEETTRGNLNIPEVFVVKGLSTHNDYYVKVTTNSVEAETEEGNKVILTGTEEFFNGDNYYSVMFNNGYLLELTQSGVDRVGVSITNRDNNLILNGQVIRQ